MLSDINKTPLAVLDKIINGEGRRILASIIDKKVEQIEIRKQRKQDKSKTINAVQPDELIVYRQFREQSLEDNAFDFDIDDDVIPDVDIDYLGTDK